MSRLGNALPFVAGALALVLAASIVVPTTVASAYWSAAVDGDRTGTVAVASVERVGTPSATVRDRNAIAVSWPTARLTDGTAVSGYEVTRVSASGAATPALGGCAGLVVATSCTEQSVPDGRWTYTVTARFASDWRGAASQASAQAIADTVAPTNAMSVAVTTGRASLQGGTLWYRGAGNGTLRLVNAVSDTLSGAGSSSTGALAGTTTGWTHVATNVATPAGGPFVSAPFSWDPGTTSAPTTDVVGFDVAGNQTATRIQLLDDSVAPTGGAISYPSGTVRPASSGGSNASVRISVASVADAGSGVVARTFERRTAPLTGDSCGAFGSWNQIASASATFAIALDDDPSVGLCVQYRHTATDAVGNVLEASSVNVVKVKARYGSTVRATPNLLHQYAFDGTGAMLLADTPTGSNSGQTTNAQTTPAAAPGAIAGEAGTSVAFDGVDDFVRINRGSIGASFSIELWFRSTQGRGSGTGHWYNGAGLVDAEVAGVQNDFGISLSADGRVLAGVGNPDTTIRSQAAGLNDGRWHQVVMTRDQGSGIVTLYVDGAATASYTAAAGNRQTLGASTSIDFGRLQTGINHYQGNLDEIALYGGVLTPAQVAEHYAAAL